MVLSQVFFNEKPVRVLAALAKQDRVWYASTICKEIDCTYPHMVKILGIFNKYGIITSEEHGRIKIIRLTEKGNYLAHDMEGILIFLDQLEGGKPEELKTKQKTQPKQPKVVQKAKETPEEKSKLIEQLQKSVEIARETLQEEPGRGAGEEHMEEQQDESVS